MRGRTNGQVALKEKQGGAGADRRGHEGKQGAPGQKLEGPAEKHRGPKRKIE